MAGKRRGKALPVAAKRRAFFTHRAQGQPARQRLAEMCDYLKAAAEGKPDRAVNQAADQVQRIAEGLDG